MQSVSFIITLFIRGYLYDSLMPWSSAMSPHKQYGVCYDPHPLPGFKLGIPTTNPTLTLNNKTQGQGTHD